MTTIAADTWGIPGPAFAVLYPVLLVAAATLAWLGRRQVGARDATPGPSLTPTEVAYLRGGDQLAVATALGQLRASGALDAQARPVAPSTSKDPVDVAVFAALGAGATARSRQVTNLVDQARVRTALSSLRDSLRARGLVRTPSQTTVARSWSIVVWAVVVLGVLRIHAGMANHKPTGVLVLELMVAVLTAGVAALSGGQGQNAAGRAAVAAAQSSHHHLDPKLRPSWATYGATGAGMSIALFGASALLLAEPAFADTVAAKQLMTTGGAGGSGDGGGSGGSSCSSGGSSCGGGCGGGGCGG